VSTELRVLEESLCSITRALPLLHVWSFYFYNILKGDIWGWSSKHGGFTTINYFRMSEIFLPFFFVIGLHGTVMSPSTVTRLARVWRKKLEKMKRKEKTALSNIQAEMAM